MLAVCFLASACQTTKTMPTSERLVGVKGMKLAALRNEMRAQNLEIGAPTFIRIFKQDLALETWVLDKEENTYRLFKTYPICNVSGNLGPKVKEGDLQAPEGFYSVGAEQMNPWSQFHLSFDVGYPNAYDRANNRTGSHLMIHGDCKSTGCYAITDEGIEDVYLMVEASIANGADVPVHIFPFRMTEANLAIHRALGWEPFWENLKTGYDLFETARIPPKVEHDKYRYVFLEAK